MIGDSLAARPSQAEISMEISVSAARMVGWYLGGEKDDETP